MISLGPIRLTRLGIGACLTLLIHGLCASQTVEAGCGHYVVSRMQHSSEIGPLDPQILRGILDASSATPIDGDHPSRPDRRFPCSGPSCSGNVPLPVAPGVLTADRLDQWGTLETLFGFSPVLPRMIRHADATPRPIGQPISIFHPPRTIGTIEI